MWYAVTANPLMRRKKEKNKEFLSREHEIILSAETEEELEKKLRDTREQYPQEFEKYMKAGIKKVEADNMTQAKIKANNIHTYFDEKGQYHIL